MKNLFSITARVFLFLMFSLGPAPGASYVESISGDLSSLAETPTFIPFDLGSNTVSGTVQASSDVRDYFAFTIQPGHSLTGIFLLNYIDGNSGAPGNQGFIHIDEGLTSILPVSGTALLGGHHLDREIFPSAATNVLTILSKAPLTGSGFKVPLGPGSYTINVQQTGPQLTAYALALEVVPEPGVAFLLSIGAGAALAARRRNRG